MSNKMTCDHCGKEFNSLVTRQGFLLSFFVEWTCEDCFQELEGISWRDYNENDYYGVEEE